MSPGPPDEFAESLIEGILRDTERPAAAMNDASELLTCLFADIRGYTAFTQQHGDEAAAKLTARFAGIVHDLVAEFGGTVVELRGDEALCVFSSPRQCLRFAVAVQHRFVEETAAEPDLPLPVGIGIDAGEAVRVADGYRGGALNLAARLCGQAKAGEVLASPEVVHLARAIDGIRYVVLDRVTLKGLPEPVRPVRVLPDGEDPVQQMAALVIAARLPTARVSWLPGPLARRPRTVMAAVALAAVVAVLLVAVLVRDSGGRRSAFAENSLAAIDPGTGRLDRTVGIPAGPTAVAAGFGSIWITDIGANSVTRVDAAALRVTDKIDVGEAPSAITTGLNSVWVVNSGSGSVSRIDPTNDDQQTIRVGVAPSGIVVAHGSVWVTNSADGTVSRIDPSQNKEVQRIAVGSGPSGISAGRDIWVANSASDTVTEIDGRRGAFIQNIPVGDAPRGVAVVDGSVWVSYNGGNAIARIATTGSSVDSLVPVGQRPDQLTAVAGHVWATLQGSGAIVEIDPATARTVRTVHLGPIPGGIVGAGGKLWVTTTSDPTLHRGGTLRLLGQVQSIDPVYSFGLDSISLLASSYDGLVAFRHASGADGLTIVPDLATTIPEPTDGGLTYTFQLRNGISWSTGQPVTADDVRRGIERGAATQATPLARLLAGASRCRPNRCDITGITVDDTTRTVTIRLVRPSGNLLDLLSTGCFAVPPGTPLGPLTTHPIPATGPYQIARFVPNKIIVFARNRHFREWSAAAQPAGFPDRIEYRILPQGDTKYAIDEVAAGRADWADALDNAGTVLHSYPLNALQDRFGSRLHVTSTQTMYGLFLNTRLPPFNDVRVRRALSYAIDRQAVADDWFAPATVTCQFLPPDYPGYRPFCPYTSRRGADTWQGSDLATAQQLLKGLHPERTTVTVWSTQHAAPGIQHVVDALRELHYQVRFRVWPKASFDYFPYVLDSRHRVQAAFMGWLTYDASAANQFSLYRCDAFVPNGGANQNPAEFCDPSLDRLMSQAEQLQATSLAQANDLWAQVERRLVTAAPWVPLVNPASLDVLSTRVHNFTRTPALGVLFDQMWVH